MGQDIKINYTADAANKLTVLVTDALGKRVITTTQNVNAGTNNLSVNTVGLMHGTYSLTIVANNQLVQEQKVVIE